MFLQGRILSSLGFWNSHEKIQKSKIIHKSTQEAHNKIHTPRDLIDLNLICGGEEEFLCC